MAGNEENIFPATNQIHHLTPIFFHRVREIVQSPHLCKIGVNSKPGCKAYTLRVHSVAVSLCRYQLHVHIAMMIDKPNTSDPSPPIKRCGN